MKILIPDDLIRLLIRFAGGKDEWDNSLRIFNGYHMILTDEDTTIEWNYGGTFGNAFLSNILKYGRHCWTFQILHIEQIAWSIIIGVYNRINEVLITETYPWIHKDIGYCYFVEDQAINVVDTPYLTKPVITNALKYDGTDIVKMTLDLDEKKINWSVNNKDICEDYAFDEIVEGMYRAVVVLTKQRNKIKLVSYEQLK